MVNSCGAEATLQQAQDSTSHDQDLMYLRRQQEIYLVFHDTQKFDSAHQTRNHKSQAVKIKRQILEHERFIFVQNHRTQR